MTEFTQLYLTPKISLLGSSLAFSLKEDPVRCAKVCDKSWVIIMYISTKRSFYLESSIGFSNLQISKKYSKELSWAWNLNLLFTVIGGKFKFQVQEGDLEYFLQKIWKTHRTFEKKPPLKSKFLFLYLTSRLGKTTRSDENHKIQM